MVVAPSGGSTQHNTAGQCVSGRQRNELGSVGEHHQFDSQLLVFPSVQIFFEVPPLCAIRYVQITRPSHVAKVHSTIARPRGCCHSKCLFSREYRKYFACLPSCRYVYAFAGVPRGHRTLNSGVPWAASPDTKMRQLVFNVRVVFPPETEVLPSSVHGIHHDVPLVLILHAHPHPPYPRPQGSGAHDGRG